MSCAFCEIIATPDRAKVVADAPSTLAFLDHRPLFPGHVLVVPKVHAATLSDLAPALVPTLFLEVQRVARAVESAMRAGGTFVAMNNRVSQSVPHLHVHVVPRTKGDGLRGFFWPRCRDQGDAELEAARRAIAAALVA
jgi:histidine triad (HIT) family protein